MEPWVNLKKWLTIQVELVQIPAKRVGRPGTGVRERRHKLSQFVDTEGRE